MSRRSSAVRCLADQQSSPTLTLIPALVSNLKTQKSSESFTKCRVMLQLDEFYLLEMVLLVFIVSLQFYRERWWNPLKCNKSTLHPAACRAGRDGGGGAAVSAAPRGLAQVPRGGRSGPPRRCVAGGPPPSARYHNDLLHHSRSWALFRCYYYHLKNDLFICISFLSL